MLDNHETDELPTMKFIPMVSLSLPATADKKTWVKLRLMGTCFTELWDVLGTAMTTMNDQLEAEPWLSVDTAEVRAMMLVMLDVYQLHLERYSGGQMPPAVVVVKLSRPEALVFWKCLMLHHPPRFTHPALTSLLAQLHQAIS